MRHKMGPLGPHVLQSILFESHPGGPGGACAGRGEENHECSADEHDAKTSEDLGR